LVFLLQSFEAGSGPPVEPVALGQINDCRVFRGNRGNVVRGLTGLPTIKRNCSFNRGYPNVHSLVRSLDLFQIFANGFQAGLKLLRGLIGPVDILDHMRRYQSDELRSAIGVGCSTE